jgi:predicted nucleic acid-binding Zn ribbon protein
VTQRRDVRVPDDPVLEGCLVCGGPVEDPSGLCSDECWREADRRVYELKLAQRSLSGEDQRERRDHLRRATAVLNAAVAQRGAGGVQADPTIR